MPHRRRRHTVVRVKLAGACACVALATILAGCGGGSKPSAKPAAPLGLDQRLLTPRDVLGMAPGQEQRFTDAGKAASNMSGILIHPKQTAAHLRSARFSVLLSRSSHSVAIRRSRKKPTGPGGELDSLVIHVGSPAAAASLLSWMGIQAEQPCPHVCDVRIQAFTPSGIPDARGVERSRAKKTSLGDAFDLDLVGFADGPFVYVISAGGQPGAFARDKVVADARTLYDRVRGAPPA